MGKKRNSRFRILSEFECGRTCVSRKPPRCNRETTTTAALDQTITRTNARTVDACAAFQWISTCNAYMCRRPKRGGFILLRTGGVVLHIADFAGCYFIQVHTGYYTACLFGVSGYRFRSTKRPLIARDSYNILVRELTRKLVENTLGRYVAKSQETESR